MEQRINAEAPAEERVLLWTTTWLLFGLKYDLEFARLEQLAIRLLEIESWRELLS